MTGRTPTARPGGGTLSGGALTGAQERPWFGPLRGFSLWDDFLQYDQTGTVPGEYRWRFWSIGGAPTVTSVVPVADTEAGIARLTTSAVAGQGGAIAWNSSAANATFRRAPPIGSAFVTKVRVQTGLNAEFTTGFV